jgi:putative effector of murein hydrolase
MADATRRVSVRLSVDGAQAAKSELRGFGEAGNRSLAQVVTGAQAASTALRLLGPVIGALSAGGLVAFARSALDTIGGLGELADQAGISTDALQAFQFAATQTGISAEELQRGIQALTRRIADAAEGQGDAANQLRRLGIAFLDASGNIRPTETVLADVADAVARVEDPAQRAAIATAVFGDRLGQRLVPFLAPGRAGLQEVIERAIAFGAVADAELIAKADEAADRVAALSSALGSLARASLAQVAPAVTAAAQAIERLIQGPSLRAQREALAGEVERIAAELREAEARAAGARKRADAEQFGDRVRQLREQLATTQALLGQVEAQTEAVGARAQRVLNPERSAAPPQRPVLPIAGGSQASELTRTLERLRAEALRQENRATEEALRERERLLQASLTPVERYQQRIEALVTLTARLQALGNPLPERAVIAEQEAALAAFNAELARTGETNRVLQDAAQDLGLTFSSAFEDAIVRGRRLSEVLQGLAQDIARIIVRRSITEPLGGALSRVIGGINFSGLFGGGGSSPPGTYYGVPFSAVPNARGNVFADGRIIPFAAGGIVTGPVLFPMRSGMGLMGEAGPEAILPLARDRSGSLGVRTSGNGGPVITQSFTIDARGADAGSEARLRALIPQIVAAARDGTLDAIRRGGYAFRTARG